MQCCLIWLILSCCCCPCHVQQGGTACPGRQGLVGELSCSLTLRRVSACGNPILRLRAVLCRRLAAFSICSLEFPPSRLLSWAPLGLWFLPGALDVIFRVIVFYPAYFQLCWNFTVSGHLRILLGWGQSFRLTLLSCSLCLAQSSVREPCVMDSLWSLGLTMDLKRDLPLHLWTTLFFIT